MPGAGWGRRLTERATQMACSHPGPSQGRSMLQVLHAQSMKRLGYQK